MCIIADYSRLARNYKAREVTYSEENHIVFQARIHLCARTKWMMTFAAPGKHLGHVYNSPSTLFPVEVENA